MSSFLNVFTQKIFFPNTKVKPKKDWEQKLSKLGSIEKFTVVRSNLQISGIYIKPQENKVAGIVIMGHPEMKRYLSDFHI